MAALAVAQHQDALHQASPGRGARPDASRTPSETPHDHSRRPGAGQFTDADILILVLPKLLNCIVAVFLIAIGLVGIAGFSGRLLA
jgi:hypothetical protein